MVLHFRRALTLVLLGSLLAPKAGAEAFDTSLSGPEIPVGAGLPVGPGLASYAEVSAIRTIPVDTPHLSGIAASAAVLSPRLAALAASANGILENTAGDGLRSWSSARAGFDGATPPSQAPVAASGDASRSATWARAKPRSEPITVVPPAPTVRPIAAAGLAAAFNSAGLLFLAHALAAKTTFPVLLLATGGAAHGIAFLAAAAATYYIVRGDQDGLKKTLVIAASALGLGAAGLAAAATFTHAGVLLSTTFGLTASNLFADAKVLKRSSIDDFDELKGPALALSAFVAPTALIAAQAVNPLLGLAVALSYRSLSNDYLRTNVPLPRLPPTPPASGGSPPPPSPAPPAPPPATPSPAKHHSAPVDGR